MIALQRIRTRGIDWSIRAMSWTSDAFLSEDDYSRPVTLRNRAGWWLEAQLSRFFAFFWSGSDEEIEAVISREVPRHAMSDRQRAFAQLLAFEGYDLDEGYCDDCGGVLEAHSVAMTCADCRALRPAMLLEDRK